MIQIGLAGWGDQDALYPAGLKAKDKLRVYARHFPVVEVDSSFYAIQPAERMARWAEETMPAFSFLVKANQEMTGHQRGKPYFSDSASLYAAFHTSIAPVAEAGKLKAVLFQYPPWFDCTREHVRMLQEARARMGAVPCALEFRNQSWFTAERRDQTLGFMKEQGWIHSVCDEPQAGNGSVPIVLEATHPQLTVVRMHGRHTAGWQQSGASNWRDVRYLYHYSDAELEEWRAHLLTLAQQSEEVCVIFNNNSGGDAAPNGKTLMGLLGLRTPEGEDPLAPIEGDPVPEQLDLFDL